MNTLSKSPVYVAREALAVGCKALRPYSNKFSPKFYTQPQLFCCLVLKTFFKLDYRGVAVWLRDLPDLRRTVGLTDVPHFTTLQKASVRLLRFRRVRRLLQVTIRRRLPRRRRIRRAAFDSTGLDCTWRSNKVLMTAGGILSGRTSKASLSRKRMHWAGRKHSKQLRRGQ